MHKNVGKKVALTLMLVSVLGAGGCHLLEQNCSFEACEEEIYEDGLCKYHQVNCYAENCEDESYKDGLCKYHLTLQKGEEVLKDWFN